jgi:hypothetical protein
MSKEWPFDQPRNFGVFCSRGIFEGGLPILLVARESDGSWQFLDGEAVRPEDTPVLVCLEDVYRLDESTAEVANLPKGWIAERPTKGGRWMKFET